MAEDGDLISRADSLISPETAAGSVGQRDGSLRMRRRRSFLASATSADTRDAIARPTRPERDEDDLPVLTEVVALAVDPAEPEEPVTAPPSPPPAVDLLHLMDWQLRCELPALIEATLLGATDQLRQGIGATIATVLGDFLAQRGQLRLPLEDTEAVQQAPCDQA